LGKLTVSCNFNGIVGKSASVVVAKDMAGNTRALKQNSLVGRDGRGRFLLWLQFWVTVQVENSVRMERQ